MSDVKPLSVEEISLQRKSTRLIILYPDRWLATLDARDAEIAALRSENARLVREAEEEAQADVGVQEIIGKYEADVERLREFYANRQAESTRLASLLADTATERNNLQADVERLTKERDEDILMTVRECSKRICAGCESGTRLFGEYHDHGYYCLASPLRRLWPEAFKEEGK